MKALIHCSNSGTAWAREFFPAYPGYLLPLANKPFLEFIIDFCILSGIRNIRLVLEDDAEKLSRHFGGGENFGIDIDYAYAKAGSSSKDIIYRNQAFCADSDVFFFSGMSFPDYDRNRPAPLIMPESAASCGESMENCFYAFIAARDLGKLPKQLNSLPLPEGALRLQGRRLSSIRDFYQINMQLVYETGSRYNLPGYGEGAQMLLGRAVEIPHSAELYPPVVIGNTVMFERNAVVGPGAVIGDNVVIDRNAFIHNTVVFDHTYIGANTELEDKICYRNSVIDPERGIRLDLDAEDEFIMSPVHSTLLRRSPLFQRISATLLLVCGFIPYYLLHPFIRFRISRKRYFINVRDTERVRLSRQLPEPSNIFEKIFLALSLDRYPALIPAAAGKLRLVGSYLLEATDENAYVVDQYPDYWPGLFSYSEYLRHEKDPVLREIDELYYLHHASFWGNFKILSAILLRNLFASR